MTIKYFLSEKVSSEVEAWWTQELPNQRRIRCYNQKIFWDWRRLCQRTILSLVLQRTILSLVPHLLFLHLPAHPEACSLQVR